MMKLKDLALALAVGLAVLPRCAGAAPPAFAILNDPNAAVGYYPSGGTDAYQTSGKTTVGTYWTPSQSYGFSEAAGVYTSICPPVESLSCNVTGLSNKTIVGYYYDQSANVHGFEDKSGVFSYVNVPGSENTYVEGIYGGTLFGAFVEGPSANFAQGFLDKGGVFSPIDDPDAVQDTGVTGMWGNTVAGDFRDAAGAHGFVETNAIFTTIDDPDATGYTGIGAIYKNVLVGDYQNNGVTNGYVDDNGTFYTVDVPANGAISTDIRGISPSGSGYTLTGVFDDSIGQHGFTLHWAPPAMPLTATAIPEPSTWLLLLTGFSTFGAFRRACQSRSGSLARQGFR